MNPLDILTNGLQMLSSWLLYFVLLLLGLTMASILCLVIAEITFERGAISRAYTVKPAAFECEALPPEPATNKN